MKNQIEHKVSCNVDCEALYHHYKNMYPHSVVLYKLEGGYCALMEDADVIGRICMVSLSENKRIVRLTVEQIGVVKKCFIPDELYGTLRDKLLYELNIGVAVIRTRDRYGFYCFPDIAESENDKILDY